MTHKSDNFDPGDGSLKPYLLRAIHRWALDHGQTPQILVDVDMPEVVVPGDRVKDGRIVLNIHPHSVAGLEMGNRFLLFSARFSGAAFEVCVPVEAVSAIYCRENGQGIVFQAEQGQTRPLQDSAGDKSKGNSNGAKKSKPTQVAHLKLVK